MFIRNLALPTPTPPQATKTEAKADTTPSVPTLHRVSLVLPIHLGDAEGLGRLPNLLLSIVKYMPEVVDTLFIVVPDTDAQLVKNAVTGLLRFARGPLFQIRVVSESELFSLSREEMQRLSPAREEPSRGGRGAGYRIQMMVKLAIARLVPTEFYVTLDADVTVMRPLRFQDLVQAHPEGAQGGGPEGGRGVTQGLHPWGEGQHRRINTSTPSHDPDPHPDLAFILTFPSS